MEVVEDIVIVGAGIAGLATALGLHRLGIRSIVLESSDSLRNTGFPLTLYTNAWKALDVIGIGETLRQKHVQLLGTITASTVTGLRTSDISFMTKGRFGEHEARCVERKLLLESLENELPRGTIRYSSKVVSVEEQGYHKLLHLRDGSILKTKVLVGCDGVKSVVAKWLGFKKPSLTGRLAIRGYQVFECSHGFEAKFLLYYGNDVRFGLIPSNDKSVYWFVTWDQTNQDKELKDNPAKMKQFALSHLEKLPEQLRGIIEKSKLESFVAAPLKYKHPWELLWGNISKGNACVAGDALHAMTPDLGQGGCSALEDGVVLARCLGQALLKEPITDQEEREFKRIEKGLSKFAKERRWRSFKLMAASYMVGFIQQSNGTVIKFLRDQFLVRFLAGLFLKMADFDCGKLHFS